MKVRISRLSLGVVSLLLVLTIGGGLVFGLLPSGGEEKIVTIPQGASRLGVARDLKRAGLIRSQLDFLLLLQLERKVLKAGTYNINPHHSVQVIINNLSQGREQYATLTIPEGWRKEQIAQELTRLGYDGAGFLTLTTAKEGALFPDTYFLPLDAKPEDILAKLDKNFQERTGKLGLTSDNLILASIVEREAKDDADRGLIAQIYLNRLAKGVKLEADPTVQYARDSNLLQKNASITFWQPITLRDYSAVQSRYNTYLYEGLPPAPIANPGLKSLQAVLAPTPTEALYFFHAADGSLVTSRTFAEHTENKKKYLK